MGASTSKSSSSTSSSSKSSSSKSSSSKSPECPSSNPIVNWKFDSPPATRNYTPKSSTEIEREAFKSSLESSRISNSSTSQLSGNSNNHSCQSKPTVDMGASTSKSPECQGSSRPSSNQIVNRQFDSPPATRNYTPKSSTDIEREALKSSLESSRISNCSTSQPSGNSNNHSSQSKPKVGISSKHQSEKRNYDHISSDVFQGEVGASSYDLNKPNKLMDLPINCGLDCNKSNTNPVSPGGSSYNSLNINKSLNEPSSVTKKVFSSDDENDNPDVMIKHDVFLKKLAANFNVNIFSRNRGFFCSVCGIFFFYFKRNINCPLKHHETKRHLKNVLNKNNINMYYCKCCKAEFYGDINFWVDHLNMEFHKFFFEKMSKQMWDSKSNAYSKNKKLNRNEGAFGTDSSLDTTGSLDASEENKSKIYALLLNGLPPKTKRYKLFNVMKDFGRVGKIILDFAGPNTAKVTFEFRFVALNIVNNGVPIKVNGIEVDVSLIES